MARVVKRSGGEALVIYPAGGPNGQLLQRLVDHRPRYLLSPYRVIRGEDFTVFVEATFRFVLPGARLEEAECKPAPKHLTASGSRPESVIASGSLPPGVPQDFYGRVADISTKCSERDCAIDASGAALKTAVEQGVYPPKPNLREFQGLTGLSSDAEIDLTHAGRSLIGRGLVEAILSRLVKPRRPAHDQRSNLSRQRLVHKARQRRWSRR